MSGGMKRMRNVLPTSTYRTLDTKDICQTGVPAIITASLKEDLMQITYLFATGDFGLALIFQEKVLADAYVKGLRGAINWTDGYAAMKKDAEAVPFYDFNPVDPKGSVKEGRGALGDWMSFGYVSFDRSTRCVSRTAEYALNDFAMSQVATRESPEDQQVYLQRSAGWQLSWNDNATSRNFTGFLAPKFANGSFDTNYDLAQCGGCNWAGESTVASTVSYRVSKSDA